ncbi:type VI secretion system tip protein VgrG [Ralstonia syzygii]|uniref:Type VI secretion system tip protein VgrG n=2 Tax=Ralstonia syzygii TaxID=28097 RepID=A0ABX7ZJA2_9RALS|nr:type VI secretion system tip protein VgrG [Ralstonia syzygii]
MTSMLEAAQALQAFISGQRQNKRLLRLSFPHDDAPAGALMVANRLSAYEGLSRDFQFSVEILSDNPDIPLKDVMGKMVTAELVREDGSLRYFNGYVFEFRFVRNDAGFSYYDMVLRPWLAFLAYRRDNYLFHGKSVEDQTDLIFGDYHDIQDWKTKALGQDEPMTDACQFDETDYNYVHRRWEARGWLYWYEHRKDGHTLVLCGDSTRTDPIDGGGEMIWQGKSGVTECGLTSFSPVRNVAATAYAASSFDFKNPRPVRADVPTINKQGKLPQLEVYEYAGAYGYKNAAAGRDFVKLRMEEIEAAGKHFEASGDDDRAQCGRTFKLSGHMGLPALGDDAKDNEFLTIEGMQSISNNYETREGQTSEYSCSLTCIRKKIPWWPGRGFNSTEPKIYGLQTAIVVGPKGEEIYTDEYGRVRVQFHWDREGGYNEKSSAWVRVASTWAGSNFGFVAIPRIGQEVIVQWLDGNPDHPLITGRVYNQDNMPPWELPANRTQTGILSRSSQGGAYGNANAFRFEDKKGSEEVWLHAEKDQRIEVEHDESHWVGHDRSKTVDNDETVHVKHDRTETVDNNETITVHNNRTERVDHNESISIGDNRTEDVGQNESISIGANQIVTVGQNKAETVAIAKALSVGGGYAVTVGGAMNTAVGLAQFEEVGLSKTVMVGQSYTTKAGKVFEVKVGKSSFRMDEAGNITLKGVQLVVEGSGSVQINGKDVDVN